MLSTYTQLIRMDGMDIRYEILRMRNVLYARGGLSMAGLHDLVESDLCELYDALLEQEAAERREGVW